MSLAEEVAQLTWWHSIDLGGGLVTPGSKTLEVHAAEFAALFDPIRLEGASLLDIGANDGANSFEAKRRGAGRVRAVDNYVLESRAVARRALGADIESELMDLMDMSKARDGVFDVVLLLGVFYHLEDPLDGLARAAGMAGEALVVETHIDLDDIGRPAMVYYPGVELNDDATNWWGPNVPLMVALLKRQGFERVDVTSVAEGRGIFHAWRSDARRIPSAGDQA